MPLYGCLTPDGYKNTEEAWLNPDAMTRRISFATSLANGRVPLTSVSGTSIDPEQLSATLGNLFSTQTQQIIATSPKKLRSALILGSPEFMHR